jgi:hypothetical protein
MRHQQVKRTTFSRGTCLNLRTPTGCSFCVCCVLAGPGRLTWRKVLSFHSRFLPRGRRDT